MKPQEFTTEEPISVRIQMKDGVSVSLDRIIEFAYSKRRFRGPRLHIVQDGEAGRKLLWLDPTAILAITVSKTRRYA